LSVPANAGAISYAAIPVNDVGFVVGLSGSVSDTAWFSSAEAKYRERSDQLNNRKKQHEI
jgi:hypothetical protein